MPWKAQENHPDCPLSKPWGVVKEGDGELEGCHATESEAQGQMAALYASEEQGRMSKFARFLEKLRALIDHESEKDRAIKDVDTWDGSASNYASTADYCSACLINVNAAAGRDEPAQSHCMLPVRGPGDGADTYVRQAVHGAAGGHGISQVKRPADVPEADWDKAVKAAANKLISVYGQMDETAPDSLYTAAGKTPPERSRALAMSQIWEQVYAGLDMETGEDWAWPVDIFEDAGQLYVIVAQEGKLYRVPLAISGSTVTMGEWQEVETQHVAVTMPEARTVVHRQADGQYRWLSISATAALNNVGEIDSRALFDKFIERATNDGEYPQRDLFHLEDAAPVGKCDMLLRDGNCLITSGVYYDTPIGRAVRQATEAGVLAGDSISYTPVGNPDLVEVASDIRVPVYRDGILKWIASLPEKDAASLFTATTVREVKRMEQRVLDALNKLKDFGLTDSDVADIVGKVDGTNRAIDDGGIINRDNETPDDTPLVVIEPEPVEQPEPVNVTLDEEALAAVAHTLTESEPYQSLAAQVESLQSSVAQMAEQFNAALADNKARATALDNTLQATAERLAALERTDAEKQSEWVDDLPARRSINVTYRPRVAHAESDGNDGLNDEAIAAAAAAKRPKK